MGIRKEINNNKTFWNKLLGENICDEISEELAYEWSEEYSNEYGIVEKILNRILEEAEGWQEYIGEGLFDEFFRVFGRTAVIYTEGRKLALLDECKKIVLDNLYRTISWIPIRILIQDINNCRESRMLRGNNSEEEYRDYCERFLGDCTYLKKLFQNYPEMVKLILVQVINLVLYIEEIVDSMHNDMKELQRVFGIKEFGNIEMIECGKSDTHRRGRSVAIVNFKNGYRLVYKPHGMKKAIYFEEVYELFCKHADVSYRKMATLDCGMYGWQEYVLSNQCKDEGEVKRYFFRMGILLFLGYFMNAGDIHGENIISSGEYPFIVDLEVFPGVRKKRKIHNVEDLVRYELSESVLSVGILPVLLWNKETDGVIINALHRNQKVVAPFKIPIICNAKRSDISIGYRNAEACLSTSLPHLKGLYISPADYVEEICDGFQRSYHFWMKKGEELIDRFIPFFREKSRYLIRHTQQYSLLLQASNYPFFFESEIKRWLFFYALNKYNEKRKATEQFMSYERNALYWSDIPSFYVQGYGTTLYDDVGKEYPMVLEESALEQWQQKLKKLGTNDLLRQLRFIKLSVALVENIHNEIQLNTQENTICSKEKQEEWKEEIVRNIADKVCDMATIYDNRDIGFSGLIFQDERNWTIAPMGMYLYDGISGIAVFMALVVKQYYSEKYERIYNLLINKLYRYTEKLEAGQEPEAKHVGAMVGEGSIINAYLFLFKLSGDRQLVEYAKRHCSYVMRQVQEDISMDYLSGCAGAIVVLLKLYQIERNEEYLVCAQEIEEKIWGNMTHTNTGSGWSNRSGHVPLAGLAHGNSGILLAYAYLLKERVIQKYVDRVNNLLDYENSLYDEDMRNWKDMRVASGERKTVNAWCHGASGILLSRLCLQQTDPFKNDIKVERDIMRCVEVLKNVENKQEIGLCHGLAGEHLILEICVQDLGISELEQTRSSVLHSLYIKHNSVNKVQVREKENYSLLNGITGVGYALIGGTKAMYLLC